MNENTTPPAIRQGWLRALLIILPFVIITLIFQGIAYIITTLSIDGPVTVIEPTELTLSQHLIMQIFSVIGTLLIVWIFYRFIDKKPFITLGFSLQRQGKNILMGLGTGFFILALGTLFLSAIGLLRIDSVEFHPFDFLVSFILCFLIGVNEEVLVRGYILNNLMSSMNKYLALVISALFFTVLHLLNPNISSIGILNIFLAGILLGISYIYTKNLWFPIALHLSWNFFQGPVFGFEVSGINLNSMVQQTILEDNLLTGGKFGFEGSVLASVFCSLFIIILGFYFKKQEVQTSTISSHKNGLIQSA